MDSPIDASDDPQDAVPELLPPSRALVPAPVGATPEHVRAWFDSAIEASEPVVDGTLASERDAAETYRRMAKAENTRRAYRAAVRAWCAWCARHDLPPLPASGQDVAAFLAGERGRKRSPETLKLRRAAIRYLHRAAGCPVPTDDACVSETMAGISRDAARKGIVPDVSPIFPPLRSRARGCRHAHRVGVSWFGRVPFLRPGHALPSRGAQPGSRLAGGHRPRRRAAALTLASTAAR